GKLVQSLIKPLPAKFGNQEASDTVTVLDDPFWLGPAENFLNTRMNGQPFGMRINMGYPQQTPAALTLSRHVSTRAKNSTADTVAWHQQTTLQSFTRNGTEPRLVAATESDFTFDRSAGLFAKIETQGDVSSQTETTSRKAKVVFKARLLAGAKLEKISADLKSSDLETRRAAVRQLNGVDVEAPADEFTGLVAAMALDSDSFSHMTAANFLGSHATTNEVPVLLKLLKDAD